MKKDDKNMSPEIDDIDMFEDFEEGTGLEDEVETTNKSVKAAPPKKAHDKEKTEVKIPAPEKPAKPTKEKQPSAKDEALHMSDDIPVQLVAVVGRTTISVKDLMNYQMGQVIDLGRPPSETVDLVASGKLFARGELVDIDGKLGVRIVKIVK